MTDLVEVQTPIPKSKVTRILGYGTITVVIVITVVIIVLATKTK